MRFPTHHIATSVTNRILNMADELEADVISRGALIQPHAPPIMGNPIRQGARIEATLEGQAAAPPAAPPIEAAPDPGASVAGKPLLATMLDPST